MATNRLKPKGRPWVVFVDRDERELHRISTDGLTPEAIFKKDGKPTFYRLPGQKGLFLAECIQIRGSIHSGDIQVTVIPVSSESAIEKATGRAK